MASSKSNASWYLVMLMLFAVILVRALSAEDPDVEKLDSQEFRQAVEERAFALGPEEGSSSADGSEPKPGPLTIYDESQKVTGLFKADGRGEPQEFEYSYPEHYDIARVLNEANVPFTTEPQSAGFWTNALVTMAPFVLILLVFLFIMRSARGGGQNSGMAKFGKSRAKRVTANQSKVTFADVAGANEAVQELTEIKAFLEAPQKFRKVGAKIPKGALLVGPPGTGKTLLARAVAGEAGVPFFSISGSDFVEMFVGVGASRVRDLFEQAKQNAPSIIFVDEIDAVWGAGVERAWAAATTSASRR